MLNLYKQDGNASASLYMAIAAASIALSSFFAKLSMTGGYSLQFTVLARFSIPLALLGIFFVRIKFLPHLIWANIRLQAIRALCLTSSQFLLFYAIQKLPLSEAMILYSTGPIFILIYDFISGKKPTVTTVISLALGMVGVCLMLQLGSTVINRYLWLGLASGFCLSISQILLHKSSRKEHPLNIMFYVYLFSTLFSVISVLFLGVSSASESSFVYGPIIALALAGIFSLGNQFFRGRAYSLVAMPSLLSPIIYFSIVVSAVLDLIYFKSFPNQEVLMGGLFVVIGSYLASKN